MWLLFNFNLVTVFRSLFALFVTLLNNLQIAPSFSSNKPNNEKKSLQKAGRLV